MTFVESVIVLTADDVGRFTEYVREQEERKRVKDGVGPKNALGVLVQADDNEMYLHACVGKCMWQKH